MDDHETEICAICHEDMETNIYSLPECTHKYHTNCIMHWFRAGHNTCPLCNNTGINHQLHQHHQPDGTLVDMNTLGGIYGMRGAALQNFKKIRRLARKKDAPKELIKQIKAIKRKEISNKKKRGKFNKFKEEIPPPQKTRAQLQREWHTACRKWRPWRLLLDLDNMKIALAVQYIKPIIVATKVNI